MQTLIIDNKTSLLPELMELITLTGIENPKFLKVEQVTYKDSENYDLVILTGATGLSVVKHPEIYREEFKIIRERTKPLLGICAGFQAIAYAYDCLLQYRDQKISGVVEVDVLKPDLIFSDRIKFTAFESHKYYISETPPELIQLAKSQYNIEVIKHASRPVYGFQFHPEVVSPQNDGREIFKAFIEQYCAFC